MFRSCTGHIAGAGGCPGIGAGIVSPAGVQGASLAITAPDNHLTAGPHCRVNVSLLRRIGDACRYPAIGAGIVSPAGVQIGAKRGGSAPDDHFAAGPHCRVQASRSRRVGSAGGDPTISAGIISPAGVQIGETPIWASAPDDHFAPSPHCGVNVSVSRHVGGASGCPGVIGARINLWKSVGSFP